MKFLWKILLFTEVLLLPQISEGNTTSTYDVKSIEKTREPENKADLFYQAINDTLRASDELKMYTQRVNCIIKYMKSEKSMDSVDKNLYTFVLNNNEFKAVFVNQSAVMTMLGPHLDKANFDCVVFGYVAIILITAILLTVVTCVACISKK